MPFINLSGKRGAGMQVIVDEDVKDQYGHLSWFLSDTGYAMRRPTLDDGSKITVRLHRLVIGAKEGEIVDHKNRNRLDNRRSNLRIVTQKENALNQKSRGYYWDKAKGKWGVRYRGKYYGRYDSKEEAQRAYQLACSGVLYKKKRDRRPKYHLPTGVYRNKTNKAYQVRLSINGKRHYLGSFATIEEAQAAYLERKRG